MLDRHVDVPVGRPDSPVQVTVDVDGPGRYLQQRYVRQHQRRIGGAQRGPAGLVETSSTQCRKVAVVIAEDQESLARAFGQVEHEAVVAPGIRMGDVAEADRVPTRFVRKYTVTPRGRSPRVQGSCSGRSGTPVEPGLLNCSGRRRAGGGPRAAAGGRFESDHRRGDGAIITTPGQNPRKHWSDPV